VTHHNHPTDHHHEPSGKRLHRDWRVWVAVLAMLAAMLAYVFSDNEALRGLFGAPKPKPPAAAQ